MNRIQIEDYQRIIDEGSIDWNRFTNKSILITGSTGLIGTNLVFMLLYADVKFDLNLRLILPVRNTEKAKGIFGDCLSRITILEYSLGSKLSIDESIDYIVHAASPTSSKFFAEKPLETISSNIEGTRAILDFAAEKNVNKIVFLSTMEVYGFPLKGHKVKENEVGGFDSAIARNSYPIAKIASEALCHSYYCQYNLPTVVLRLTQTFGAGVDYYDSRVFGQFMRCAIEGKDIVLKSPGLTERSYLYTADAVSSILVALLNGESGEAYSVANPSTYCSIKEMADMVVREFSDGKSKVVFDIAEDITKLGYADTLYMDLDISKIERLGWHPVTDLQECYHRMILSVQNK